MGVAQNGCALQKYILKPSSQMNDKSHQFHRYRPTICKRLISNLFDIVGDIQRCFLIYFLQIATFLYHI